MMLPGLALLFVCMQAIPLRVFGYNPLSASCDDRLTDILQETTNFNITLLASTCIPATLDAIPRGEGRCFSAGYRNSKFSNKSCGTLIALGKRFNRAKIFDPQLAPQSIAGRGIAVRTVAKFGDFCPIAAYYPPVPWDAKLHAQYRATCTEVTKWIAGVLDRLPAGCTPILYTDLNDGMGLQHFGKTSVVAALFKGNSGEPGPGFL